MSKLCIIRNFTLLELVLVISVISILGSTASIIVRNKTQQAICATNMRRLHLGIIMYANDHNGFIPPMRDTSLPRIQSTWYRHLASLGYIDLSNKGELIYCRSGGLHVRGLNANRFYRNHYSNMKDIKKPSLLIVFADTDPDKGSYYTIHPSKVVKGRIGPVGFPHNGMANCIFLDGHLSVIPPSELPYF